MITKTINLYSFDELSKEAQDKAIASLSNINVDYDWWDFVYEDFAIFCQLLGIEVDLNKTNFSLSYSQSDGCAFTASIDLQKLLHAIKNEVWKEGYPKETISFLTVTANIERVARLIGSGKIDGSAHIRQTNRETKSIVESDYGFHKSGLCINPIRVVSALDDLTDLLQDVAKTLNSWLFQNLRNEYDYLLSNEAIIETIKSNDYTFTENGKLESL